MQKKLMRKNCDFLKLTKAKWAMSPMLTNNNTSFTSSMTGIVTYTFYLKNLIFRFIVLPHLLFVKIIGIFVYFFKRLRFVMT